MNCGRRWLKLPFAIATCAHFWIPESSAAQVTLSLSGGAVVPVGSTSRPYKPGYDVTIGLAATPPLSSVGIRLEGMFNELGAKDTTVARDTSAAGVRIIGASLSFSVSPAGAAPPISLLYLIGGVGVYRSKPTKGPSTSWNDDFGFNLGAGLSFGDSPIEPFLEVRVHRMSTEGGPTKFMPITFGIRF